MNDAASSSPSRGPRMLALWHLLALGADLAVIAVALVITWFVDFKFGNVPNLPLLILGAAMTIISVNAAWLALGPLARSVRMLAAPLVSLAALLAATILLAVSGANGAAVAGIFVAGLAQFLLLQTPYWLLRFWHRLRIVHLDEVDRSGPIERLQYRLWQMLTVMTLAALALGIGRVVFALLGRFDGPRDFAPQLIGFFALLVGYNLLLAWPLIWAVLSPASLIWKAGLAAMLVILVVVVAYPIAISIIGAGEGLWLYWLIFVPQPAFLLTHLLATRGSGYRLVRNVSLAPDGR